eukprot:1149591-Pelagomonas_calceolata.AAC.1
MHDHKDAPGYLRMDSLEAAGRWLYLGSKVVSWNEFPPCHVKSWSLLNYGYLENFSDMPVQNNKT